MGNDVSDKVVKYTLIFFALVMALAFVVLLKEPITKLCESRQQNKLKENALAAMEEDGVIATLEQTLQEETGLSDLKLSVSSILCPDYFYDKYDHVFKVYVYTAVNSDEILQYVSDPILLVKRLEKAAKTYWYGKQYFYHEDDWTVNVVVNPRTDHVRLKIVTSDNRSYEYDDSDSGTLLWVNGHIEMRTRKNNDQGTSSSKPSSSGTQSSKPSSKPSSSSWMDSYDEGYEDVYYDEDYDQDRYDRDSDYAAGVDDAMEDDGGW